MFDQSSVPNLAYELPPPHPSHERIQQEVGNFEAAVALNFGDYNFCKKYTAINYTPATEAGVESKQWTVAELVEACGE